MRHADSPALFPLEVIALVRQLHEEGVLRSGRVGRVEGQAQGLVVAKDHTVSAVIGDEGRLMLELQTQLTVLELDGEHHVATADEGGPDHHCFP